MAEKKSKLAVIKTKPTSLSVEEYIKNIEPEQKRNDSLILLEIFKKATGESSTLWSSSIIGFGFKRYKSPASGREVDWFKIGFAPRKATLTLYLTVGLNNKSNFLEKLGKHKTDGGCIYINKLADVDMKILEAMILDAAKKPEE
jgi:hypothetical protein